MVSLKSYAVVSLEIQFDLLETVSEVVKLFLKPVLEAGHFLGI